ncbi:MAG: hypothetical protein GX045_08195 [Clostridiaceae bacterium]|nr:hypothetical protein [Clostridiaceae bacterium]
MSQFDRIEACKILGVNQDATKDEIAKRYGVLARKFRTIEKDENGYTIEDITKAYNLLMGITYIDKAEEERQRALRENPPILSRILKKDPVKVENFLHYYKIYFIVGAILLVALFSLVRSCITNVPPDFYMVFYGNIYTDSEEKISNDLINNYPDITAPSVEVLPLMSGDPQYEAAIRMKMAAMTATREIDIILLDEETFKESALQGMFHPLDDFVNELDFPEEAYIKASARIGETEDGKPVFEEAKKYGIDITDSEFIKENNIVAEKVIATIVVNSKRVDMAKAVVKAMK